MSKAKGNKILITSTSVENEKKQQSNFYKSTLVSGGLNILFRAAFIATLIDGIYSVLKSVYAIITLDATVLNQHLAVLILRVIAPAILWAISTLNKKYKFHRLKVRSLRIVLLHAVAVTWQALIQGVMLIITSLMLYIPVNKSVKPEVVAYFAYYILGTLYTLTIYMALITVSGNLHDELTLKRIKKFALEDFFSGCKIKRKHRYNLEYIRYLDNGRKYVISMKDRWLHLLCLGSTGTGKTSASVLVAIEHDLTVIIGNLDTLKKRIVRMYEKGQIRMKHEMSDADFDLNNFTGTGKDAVKWDKRIQKMKEDIPVAGITVMCPNAALADNVYKLAKAKGIKKINRIDPVYGADGNLKEGSIGMNPLYIDPPESFASEELFLEKVFSIASHYSDVNQSIFESSQRSDPYFSGLNKNVTVNATIVMVIAVPLVDNKNATILDIQRVINNLTAIKEYRDAIVLKYGKISPGMTKPDMRAGFVDVGEILTNVINRIDIDFLGDNAKKTNEQAMGLRNIIDDSIMHPRIRKILTSDNTINFDKILADSEITIINYEIGIGPAAKGFGLFFLLNYIDAVEARPLDNRPPHFFYIDEFHVLMHPKLEDCATLFRQYQVGCFFLTQSLSQFDKSDLTKHMKNVYLSNIGHQVIFGRAGNEEMRVYSELAGTETVIEEEISTRETALSMEKTQIATNIGQTVMDKERLTSDDLRYRRPLECTVFSVRHNMPLAPFLGKVDWLPPEKERPVPRIEVPWDMLMDEDTIRYDTQNDISPVINKTFRTTTDKDGDDEPSYRHVLPDGVDVSASVETIREKTEDPITDNSLEMPKVYKGGLLTGTSTAPVPFSPPKDEDTPINTDGSDSNQYNHLRPDYSGVEF